MRYRTSHTHESHKAINSYLYLLQLASARQSIALLQQDKDYLSKQVNDATNRCEFAEEKLKQVNQQLDHAKQAREEVYEKYISSR